MALFLGALLARLLFAATAQSFDTMIYARGLWGLAHLDPSNPVLGVPTLAVHAHGLLVVLAPLARLVDATTLLIAAQSLAAGATVALAAVWASRSFGSPTTRAAVALAAVVALVPCSPWVANPMLFDARPDLAGVPFALAAMLVARDAGRFDRRALALAWAAIAMREEFALLTLIPAALFAPLRLETPRSRLRTAARMFAYWTLYWFVLRDLLGGDASTVEMRSYSRLWLSTPSSAAAIAELAMAKVELLGAAVATGGGLAVFGGRWLWAAAPAVAFVVVTSRLQSLQLNFHYPLFAAPALIVASLAGLERARSWVSRRSGAGRITATAVPLAVSAIACATFALSSAWPGGGRWRPDYFAVGPTSLARHALVDALDDREGLIVPYEFGAAVADRPAVWTTLRLARVVREGGVIPDDFAVVVLTSADLVALGPTVAAQFGDFGTPVANADATVYRRRSSPSPAIR